MESVKFYDKKGKVVPAYTHVDAVEGLNLPELKTIYVNVTSEGFGDNVTYTADKTYSEILEYLQKGADVRLSMDGLLFSFVAVVNGSLVFSAPFSQTLYSLSITSEDTIVFSSIQIDNANIPNYSVAYSGHKLTQRNNDVVSAETIVQDGGGYIKPDTGIPKTDLESDVQQVLARSKVHVYNVGINVGYSADLKANAVLDSNTINIASLEEDITNGVYVVIQLHGTDDMYENYYLAYYDGEAEYFFANFDGEYGYQMLLIDDGNGNLKVKGDVSEIRVAFSSSKKLNPNYITTNATHQWLTNTYIDAWNNKANTDDTTETTSAKDSVGAAKLASGIPFGVMDNDNSINTAFVVTADGIKSLRDGVCVYITNTAVAATTGCTLNLNGLGAKPIYRSDQGAATTLWALSSTYLFIYNSSRNSGNGGWDLNTGYDSNTIGYQLRTNYSNLPMAQALGSGLRMLFTSADGTKWVPANTSNSSSYTTIKTVNTAKINPFGPIVYFSSSAAVAANARPGATYLWKQYAFYLGYSFNITGGTSILTQWKPVYLKCTPQSDGSAVIDSTTPFVQDLPSTEDEKIYIFLGIAYSTSLIELRSEHPVYCYKQGRIQLWTGLDITSYMFGTGATTIPASSDLDNYVTPGVYISRDRNTSLTISNTPYTYGAFRLFVMSCYTANTWNQQILISHSGIWARSMTSSGVYQSTWKSIVSFF